MYTPEIKSASTHIESKHLQSRCSPESSYQYYSRRLNSKASDAILSAYEDPNLFVLEEKKFIKEKLILLGGSLFANHEIEKLSAKLPYIFRRKEFIVQDNGQIMISEKKEDRDSIISALRLLLSSDVSSSDFSQKEKIIYEINQDWIKKYTFNSTSKYQQVSDVINKFKSTYKSYGIKLFHNEDTSYDEADAIKKVFALLPDKVLEILKEGLSGGIHLSVPDLNFTGVYDLDTKGIYLSKAHEFTSRGFVELLLHEIGHACEDRFIADKDFIALFEQASKQMYQMPAIDEEGKIRSDYISKSISEFFAETFMHYVLQGKKLEDGFIGASYNSKLYKNVYNYFKQKVFNDTEYQGKIYRSVPAKYQVGIHHRSSLDSLKVLQALRAKI